MIDSKALLRSFSSNMGQRRLETIIGSLGRHYALSRSRKLEVWTYGWLFFFFFENSLSIAASQSTHIM